MSGTSMDGLDMALCAFTGSGFDTQVRLVAFETESYDAATKAKIMAIFAKPVVDFQLVCMLNPWVGNLHGRMVAGFLARHKIDPQTVDVVASHGQTVLHAPRILHGIDEYPNATLQIGDGDHVARSCGIITLSDFRQKHCAAGGEGAPLALYGDMLLYGSKAENRILLNMGGIANFTFLPADLKSVYATDTGPGNTLMDAWARTKYNQAFDHKALIAKGGSVNNELLEQLLKDPFFEKPFPKTTGPELLGLLYLDKCLETMANRPNSEDIMATLSAFSGRSIAMAIDKAIGQHAQAAGTRYAIYASGGGVHNPLLMDYLKQALPSCSFDLSDSLGIPADAKEAVLFATLANEALAGGKVNYSTNAAIPNVSMGKVSFVD
jgi:anhydro-N-acetylmuramic acid kinase